MVSKPRHDSLDLLRGFALLGILVMNIQSFSMPLPAYTNPHAFGSMEGIHGLTWLFSHVLFDTKFYSLFALMFGAGIMLLSRHAVIDGGSPAARHYRRMLFLALVGLAHGFLVWDGDILFTYAVSGSVAWLFVRRSIGLQIGVAIPLILLPTGISLWFGWSLQYVSAEVVADMRTLWGSDSPLILAELAAFTGGYADQLPVRAENYLSVIIWGALVNFWHATGLMLLGMALYRVGFLTAELRWRSYVATALLGLAAGLLLVLWGLWEIEARDWAFPWTEFSGRQFNTLAAPLMALAYAALIMLAFRAGLWPRLQVGLVAVGRTAFSNYLLQTVICTLVFYGHGLGLFGQVERAQQLLIVIAVWLFQILLSVWWLRHFRHGPVEWLGRAVTRLQLPSMRR